MFNASSSASGGYMAGRPARSKRQLSDNIARAREVLAKYELDRANPIGDFRPDETIEEDFAKLINQLS
jgi:hypothetical protein